jgi:ERCC4-related helicase
VLLSTVRTAALAHAAQAVVQNLMISRIEFRDDTDPDVVKYCHPRSREQRLVPVCQEGRLIRQLLRKLMTPLAMRLNSEAEVCMTCLTHSRNVCNCNMIWHLSAK